MDVQPSEAHIAGEPAPRHGDHPGNARATAARIFESCLNGFERAWAGVALWKKPSAPALEAPPGANHGPAVAARSRSLTTSELYERVELSLHGRQWDRAQHELDLLSRRKDLERPVPGLEAYAWGHLLSPERSLALRAAIARCNGSYREGLLGARPRGEPEHLSTRELHDRVEQNLTLRQWKSAQKDLEVLSGRRDLDRPVRALHEYDWSNLVGSERATAMRTAITRCNENFRSLRLTQTMTPREPHRLARDRDEGLDR